MKKIIYLMMVMASFSMTGCIAKMTGPGSAGVDLSKMKMVEQQCFVNVLGFGPFNNALLTKSKFDAIQYSFENYVVWGRVCAEGYKK